VLVDPVAGLTSLLVTGTATVNSTAVQTTALQTYQGAVTLGSDVVFEGGGQRFDSTITGPGRTLLMLGSSDGITLGGDVGTAAAPLGPIAGLTFVGTILVNAAVYSTGPVTFFSLFGSIDGGPANAIYVPAGDLSLAGLGGVGVTNPIAVEAATVAAIATVGDIRLRGIGDLVVGDPGIMTDGTLSLDASGQIRVPGGRMLRGEDGVTATKPIRWGLVGTADSGTGSLRDVIGQANATGVAGIVEFGNAPATFVLGSQLPEITTSLVIDGGNRVTISGNRRVANGITFAAGSSGSQLKNVALQGFRNFGVRLDNSPGVLVDGVRVTSLNTWESMGLHATGNLAGSSILSSRFSGGIRGALLVNARNLAVGAVGRGNTFAGNRSVPGSTFAGTGIRAQGDSTGTVVEGNTFTQNHYGFAFINARNLRLANNVFTRNAIAAIFVEGINTGSVAVGNTFGSGAQKNARTIQRLRGATGV
jgi:parallel beta-helix repeat protein